MKLTNRVFSIEVLVQINFDGESEYVPTKQDAIEVVSNAIHCNLDFAKFFNDQGRSYDIRINAK